MADIAPGVQLARRRSKPPGRRRRRRLVLIGVTSVLVLIVLVAAVAVAAMAMRPPGPQPLTLPAGPAQPAVAAPLPGTWTPTAGSAAGFRVGETILGMTEDIVGRTGAVTGTVVAAGDRITSAAFDVDLTKVTVNGEAPAPQFGTSLDIARHPTATVTLAEPVPLPAGLGSGDVVTITVTGSLELRGVRRPVTMTVAARRTGPAIEAAGAIPVSYADWGVPVPEGFGVLGSLADHGVAEFLLILRRR
jgi:polyisoprenoid-binding protein YceI